MDADGSHSRSLTAALDRDAGEPQWSGDGKRIFFEYGDRGTIKLASIDMSGNLRTLAAVPWQVVVETGQVFALAARKASGRPAAPGALRTVPLDAGPDVRGWPAARREAVLTALLSAAPNTVVVDIDMEAGTALVHQLISAAQPDARPALPG